MFKKLIENWAKKREIKAYSRQSAKIMFKFFQEKYDLKNSRLGEIKMPYIGYGCQPEFGGVCLTNPQRPGFSIININDIHCMSLIKNLPYHFLEYNHYADNSEIGNIFVTSWQEYITVLIAHEISHSFEMFLLHTVRKRVCSRQILGILGIDFRYGLDKIKNEELQRLYSLAIEEKDLNLGNFHGKLFQEIYKIFRNEFCNFEKGQHQ